MLGLTTVLALGIALIPTGQDTVPVVDVVIPVDGLADSGTVVELEVGETAGLTLRENASTGFRWYLDIGDPVDPIVEVTFDEYVARPNPDRAVGVGGGRHWIFSAVRPGRITVTLTSTRGGPPSAGSSADLSFTVEVSDAPGGAMNDAKASTTDGPPVLLTEDARGGVWVGCNGRLAYYDSAPSGRVCDAAGFQLASDRQGGVWVYCGGYLGFYDRAPLGAVCR